MGVHIMGLWQMLLIGSKYEPAESASIQSTLSYLPLKQRKTDKLNGTSPIYILVTGPMSNTNKIVYMLDPHLTKVHNHTVLCKLVPLFRNINVFK